MEAKTAYTVVAEWVLQTDVRDLMTLGKLRDIAKKPLLSVTPKLKDTVDDVTKAMAVNFFTCEKKRVVITIESCFFRDEIPEGERGQMRDLYAWDECEGITASDVCHAIECANDKDTTDVTMIEHYRIRLREVADTIYVDVCDPDEHLVSK